MNTEHYKPEIIGTPLRDTVADYINTRLQDDLALSEPPPELDAYLKQASDSFSRVLLAMIRDQNESEVDIYKRAFVSRQHFSKIRSDPNYQPKKSTAIAFALALQLNTRQTDKLLASAGYTLSHSSRFDLIIRFFLEQGRYNLEEINNTLFSFDQPLLYN